MASNMRKVAVLLFTAFIINQYALLSEAQSTENTDLECDLVFDRESANESISFQTSLGPRVPGSEASSDLRVSIKENLTGWRITETTHFVDGMILTNLFATWNHGLGSEVILAAHYDTRDRAERDPDENRTMEPILGANDGASGVAVLLELAKIIPSLELDHEVTLFFTDGEDQGVTPSFLGARAWSENLTQEEADEIESFILVDMVGDADLTLTKTLPGNETLWLRTEESLETISAICEGYDLDFYDNETIHTVWDDHIYALAVDIPSIDIIDIKYGPNASAWQGYWHTHEDTADKVSAESLEKVGKLVEFGLREGVWLDVRENSEENENTATNPLQEADDSNEDITENTSVGFIFIGMIIIIWGNLLYLIYADNQSEG